MIASVVSLLLGGMLHASILFLGAAGLQVVFGVQKIFNLACGSFYALGVYVGVSAVHAFTSAGGPPGLTVAENVEIATWTRRSDRPAAERIRLAYDVFPRLRDYATRGGTHLSGGERKMLSIARALVLDPALLLLDEPFEGLSPAIIPQIGESLGRITREGRAILLAESNIHHVPVDTTRLYVIERGEIIYGGPPAGVRREPAVLRIIGG